MNDCNVTADSIDRIACILSYNGNRLDTGLNYSALFAHLLVERTVSRSRSTTIITSLFCFLFVICFQIMLCYNLGCAGISIVWCACLGWQSSVASPLPLWLLTMDAVLLLYYAVTMEWMTTLAHVCAILLGRGLSVLSLYAEDWIQQRRRSSNYRPMDTN